MRTLLIVLLLIGAPVRVAATQRAIAGEVLLEFYVNSQGRVAQIARS